MQGGVGAYTQILARELLRQGQQVFIFSSPDADSEDLPLTHTHSKWGWRSLRDIGQWAATEKLDVVNLQFQTAAYGMSPWIHFLPDYVRHIPIVTTFHDLRFPYIFPKAGPLRQWIVQHLARTSGGIIVTNHEDYLHLKHLPHITLIPIGSNILMPLPHDFEPLHQRQKAGAQPGEFLLTYFGLMNRSKGVDLLLESMATLRSQGLPVKLVLLGGRTGSSDPSNTAYADEIEQLIAQHGLQKDIHWTGYLSEREVGAYLSASDGVVLPFTDGASYRRGSLMAAIYYGCPIVTTTPQVLIPEFIPGENMLFAPLGDGLALTEILARLLKNSSMQAHLRQGAAVLAKQFDWSQIAADYIRFFNRVTGVTV